MRCLLWAVLLLGAPLFGSCRQTATTEAPAQEPELRRLRRQDPQTGTVIHSWSVLIFTDGRALKHGKERRWFASGARHSEAEYDRGELTGDLRRWYGNGQLRTESSFDPSGRITPMTFWHANGQIAARGSARRGTREGHWEFWFENGARRESGGYVGGLRAGLWQLHHEDGSVSTTGRFESGERVGPWQHYLPGEHPEGTALKPAGSHAPDPGPG